MEFPKDYPMAVAVAVAISLHCYCTAMKVSKARKEVLIRNLWKKSLGYCIAPN